MKKRGSYKTNRLKALTEAALLEFAEKGFERVTMAGISRRAGLTTSAIYYYFHNKHAVLAAIHDRLFEPVRAMMLRAGHAPDALAGLRQFLKDYLEYWATHPHELEYRLIGTSALLRQRGIWPYVSAQGAGLVNWYDSMLYLAMKQGTLVRHRWHARATALFCAVEGAVPYVAMARLFPPKRMIARIDEALLKPLEKR